MKEKIKSIVFHDAKDWRRWLKVNIIGRVRSGWSCPRRARESSQTPGCNEKPCPFHTQEEQELVV
ncbi:MAG TPA: hypothetical protein VF910_03065 [Candidatus Bathyarchaeia archaeon]